MASRERRKGNEAWEEMNQSGLLLLQDTLQKVVDEVESIMKSAERNHT